MDIYSDYSLTESNVLGDLSPSRAVKLLSCRCRRLHLFSEVLAEPRLSLPGADAGLAAFASESEKLPLKTATL